MNKLNRHRRGDPDFCYSLSQVAFSLIVCKQPLLASPLTSLIHPHAPAILTGLVTGHDFRNPPARLAVLNYMISCPLTESSSVWRFTPALIIMYIYHALINALSAHMIHTNLNTIYYTHIEQSPTNAICIKYYLKQK